MQVDANLPLNPVGYFMLVEERKAENTSKGGIVLPSESIDAQQYLNVFGKVVAMGDNCYRHKEFQNTPWCEVGDLIMFHKHSGMRIDVKAANGDVDTRYRLLKDNDVIATVNNPDVIRSAVY